MSYYTGQQKKDFFQNAFEIYTYSGAEWCPKHDVVFFSYIGVRSQIHFVCAF